ncbi:pyridoxamine 5'-phosphate oxidase family protein [Modestobacter sp. Leaf380]|uniref:pyridoxamine 5'-phosphate oxidase family protein n=1 Tax=Modestobacter sp. Leaf380 TaxID=1736356 RepID=UPI0006F7DB89|nr:pyridoxamine 5'-phosphate oxidase family protein [Modestobacter sp. Leaf380]KQS66632.1 pyridoxamine 5'-phosphate oxidase [Modestobacter sp. Leaf380]
MTDDSTRKVSGLLSDQRLGMLTTTDRDGTLISRPMALQEVEFDGDLWFFAARDSRKVAHITANPHVNVAVGSGSTWISLTGTAAVVTDDAKKKELWNSGVAAWFPDGPDDDEIVLIKVDGDSAEYWDTPGGRVSTLLSFAKAKVTGEAYSGGENEKVDLP